MSSTARIEPLYVVDTHGLFWYLTDNPKLSVRASEIFQAAERGETQLVISVIVLAELYHLNLKLPAPLDFAAIYTLLAENPAYLLVGFEPTHVLDFIADASIPELHDRIIGGLAKRLDAPLITRDESITASKVARIEW